MRIASVKLMLLVGLACGLAACSDDDDNDTPATPEPPQMRTFTVEVKNLTEGQPFSPIAVIATDDEALWQVGESASVALEMLAESGDNSQLLALPEVISSVSGSAPVLPGMSDTVTLEMEASDTASLTVAGMLGNTNDAFTGFTGWALSHLESGESMIFHPFIYDAGTEENTESAATVPGPAAGGEGFNAERESINKVTMHSGVVSMDDGLSSSALTQVNRFDNPAVEIIVTRME